jgi:hypothetical protein
MEDIVTNPLTITTTWSDETVTAEFEYFSQIPD